MIPKVPQLTPHIVSCLNVLSDDMELILTKAKQGLLRPEDQAPDSHWSAIETALDYISDLVGASDAVLVEE